MNASSDGKRHRLLIGAVWLLLMAATVISTWGVSAKSVPAHIAVITTFLIAAFKIRLVILHFMDLRDAPLPWRAYFEGWILVVTAALLSLYLTTPGAGS